MRQKTTEELFDELAFAKTIDDVLEQVRSCDTLPEHLERLLREKRLKKSEVIKRSGLNPTFAYQIFKGERNASRNKLLQLAFALELTAGETQRLLALGGCGQLYSRNRRDAIVLFCLMKGKTLEETDDLLYDKQETPICGD